MVARTQENLAPGTRSLIAAALLALGLAIWRMVAVLPAEEPPATRSQLESQINAIASRLTGPQAVHVSATQKPDGTRDILILLNAAEGPVTVSPPLLADLFTAAGLFDEAAGDRLEIREAEFAAKGFARPTHFELAEIVALFGLAAWIGWVVVLSNRGGGPVATAMPTQPVRPEPVRRTSAPETSAVLSIARRDPARTARVVRAWLSAETVR